VNRKDVEIMWRSGFVAFALAVCASLTHIVLSVVIEALGGVFSFTALLTLSGALWGIHHALLGVKERDDS